MTAFDYITLGVTAVGAILAVAGAYLIGRNDR